MFSFDPYSPAIDADPFPFYKTLRDEAPCFWSPEAQTWVLSRYADIVSAGQDWQTFSSAKGNLMTELPGRAGATLGTTDPPRHDRLRGLGIVPQRLVLDLGIELLKPLERAVPVEEPAQQREGSIDLVGVSLRFGAHEESPRVGRVSGLRWP